MERATPVRSSHASTAGMLAWPHPDGAAPPPARRPNQPTEEFRKVVFGGQGTGDEAEAEGLSKRRPSAAPKSKEMTGSGIFDAERIGDAPAAVRNSQVNNTVSQISFAEDPNVPSRKQTSVAEARQQELSRTVQSEGDGTIKRKVANTKSKELSGHDIFADYEDPRPNRSRRSDYSSSAQHSPVKNANVSTFSFGEANFDSTPETAKKMTSNKSTVVTGNDIFEGDSAPGPSEMHMGAWKATGVPGINFFADGEVPTRGRTRQPPGGDSSISLV